MSLAESAAFALERELAHLATTSAGVEPLWPGFDPLAVPLAVYDGERTFLFRHPAPPQGFSVASNATPTAYVRLGRHESVIANTNANIGGVPTATILLDRPQARVSLVDHAAVAVHEAFHVYQRGRHPSWIGNEADLFTYPIGEAGLLALRRLETEALRRALAGDEAESAACWARKALLLRKERYARMDSVFAAYERGTELNEGLALYVEMRAASRHAVDLPPTEFGPTEIRRRAYITGAALALLLDRFMAGWPVKFESNDYEVLDTALASALGSGSACTFDATFVAQVEDRAHTDVAAHAADLIQRFVVFEEKPGWQMVVEAGHGEPLWPQGFDPLNVEHLGAARVLHTRFLHLVNGAGKLEVLNEQALTEGVGPHPLFNGIRRVVLTGLAEPDVCDVEGRTTVQMSGLRAEFRDARVTRGRNVLTIRLGK